MKHIYNKDDHALDDTLWDEAYKIVNPHISAMIGEFKEAGFHLRDAQWLAVDMAMLLFAEEIMRLSVKERSQK